MHRNQTKRTIGKVIPVADRRSTKATLYLLSISGMRKSIRKGMAEPLEKCSDKVSW